MTVLAKMRFISNPNYQLKIAVELLICSTNLVKLLKNPPQALKLEYGPDFKEKQT